MYLVDTNVWLEQLLDQEKADDVRRFLDTIPSEALFIADFAFHSIGLALTRLGHSALFLRFSNDVLIDGAVRLVALAADDMEALVSAIQQFSLDFDDAYQIVAAEKYSLTLVSFDADFDRTERGRKTPAEVLQASHDPDA